VIFRHSRTGITAFLSQLSAAAELLIINLVAHHDPESDPQFPSCRDPGFSHSFLYQFASIEAFQLWIHPDRVQRCFAPEVTHQRVALLAHRSQSLPAPAGVLAGDHTDVARKCFAVGEPLGVSPKHFGGQRCDRTDSRMRHQSCCLGTLLGLFTDLPIEVLDSSPAIEGTNPIALLAAPGHNESMASVGARVGLPGSTTSRPVVGRW
jgi:hypothetical protein